MWNAFAADQCGLVNIPRKKDLLTGRLVNRVVGVPTMMAGDYERRTMAAMEVALDRVCERWPNGGTHKVRKRAARGILRCADAGNTSLDALIEAGERALAQPPRGQKGTGISFDQLTAA
jgi:hypothetical protein